MNRLCVYAVALLLTCSCSSVQLKNHAFPIPEDTSSVPVNDQLKTSYRFDGVYVDNRFDGARTNGFRQINDTTFRVIVSPENTPINASSYYAFRIRSEKERNVDLEIEYTEHVHRYVPKLSYDKKHWMAMDSLMFDTIKAGNLATLQLELDTNWLYVAGQELMTTQDADYWTDSLTACHAFVTRSVAGQSIRGRDLLCLDIAEGKAEQRDVIVIFGRLHPPEVPGYIAMKAFVETLLDTTRICSDFRKKYRVLVYPMLNPDGVDLGHWRHNCGGIDLNRDWSHYRQKEVSQVAQHVVKEVNKNNNDVILGLDFHATQEDVYYTLTDNRVSNIRGFKDYWFEALEGRLDDYKANEEAYDLNQPITKGWFFLQFGAESITYEVGDETPRDFICRKAKVAAEEMMKLLILRKL